MRFEVKTNNKSLISPKLIVRFYFAQEKKQEIFKNEMPPSAVWSRKQKTRFGLFDDTEAINNEKCA